MKSFKRFFKFIIEAKPKPVKKKNTNSGDVLEKAIIKGVNRWLKDNHLFNRYYAANVDPITKKKFSTKYYSDVNIIKKGKKIGIVAIEAKKKKSQFFTITFGYEYYANDLEKSNLYYGTGPKDVADAILKILNSDKHKADIHKIFKDSILNDKSINIGNIDCVIPYNIKDSKKSRDITKVLDYNVLKDYVTTTTKKEFFKIYIPYSSIKDYCIKSWEAKKIPAEYIQVENNLYIIDKNKNVLKLKNIPEYNIDNIFIGLSLSHEESKKKVTLRCRVKPSDNTKYLDTATSFLGTTKPFPETDLSNDENL